MESLIRVVASVIIIVSLICGFLFHDKSNCVIEHCTANYHTTIDDLEQISKQLISLISALKEEIGKDKVSGELLNPASSCKKIPPTSSSGEYWVKPTNSPYPFKAFCVMNRRCGESNRLWMRVANIDMTDPRQDCPDGLKPVTRSTAPLHTCGRQGPKGCVSIFFPVNGTEYSKVCGRVKAYQYGSPDAFLRYDNSRYLDSHYVDGVSITHGRSPRTHIWTFAASYTSMNCIYGCPCSMTDCQGSVPSFIGDDYFCESGHRNEWSRVFYPDNVLWDGVGCDSISACCIFNNPPWFCKDLPRPTTNDIELRLCGDQDTEDEDTPIEAIEIYVH